MDQKSKNPISQRPSETNNEQVTCNRSEPLKRKRSNLSASSNEFISPAPRKFLKINRQSGLLDCKICSKLFQDPVKLPCGDTICREHIDSLYSIKNDPSKSTCSLCNKTFTDSIRNIKGNKSIQDQVDIEIREIRLGENYKKTIRFVENVEKELMELEGRRAANFIPEYLSELKDNAKIKLDEQIKKATEEYNSVLTKINRYETKYNAVETHIDFFSSKLNDYFDELLETTRVNEEKWKEISLFTTFYKRKIHALATELQFSYIKYTILGETETGDSIEEFSGQTEGFYQFQLSNYQSFSKKDNSISATKRFKINETEWYIEFGNEGKSDSTSDHKFSCYLCYDTNLNQEVDVEFLFEFIDISDVSKSKAMKIPLPTFSYSNDTWSFDVMKELVDRFYDEENDAVHFCIYIRPVVRSNKNEFTFKFE